jgi:hypothetical protein
MRKERDWTVAEVIFQHARDTGKLGYITAGIRKVTKAETYLISTRKGKV